MMKEKKIAVLKVEPGKHPEKCILANDLDSLQKAVSIGADYQGLIEIIGWDGVCILCNEEGKIIGLDGNRRIGDDIIAGVFYITAEDQEGNLASLTDAQIEQYRKRFWTIEYYTQQELMDALDAGFCFYV